MNFIAPDVSLALPELLILLGSYAKLVVLQAIISQGMVWLAVYSVLFSVIGAFYYLRVVEGDILRPAAGRRRAG